MQSNLLGPDEIALITVSSRILSILVTTKNSEIGFLSCSTRSFIVV